MTVRTAITILMILLVTGCASRRPGPVEIVEVVREVPVVCEVEEPAHPVYATESLTADDSDYTKIRALWIEKVERTTMERILRNLLRTCIK